jgi:hypothetical protein
MAKTSVSAKMLGLCDLYLQRIEANLREELPKSALYWAVMVHSQYALARAMADDGQMTPEVFSEMNRHDKRAFKLIARLGPASGPKLEGSKSGQGDLGAMLRAYDQFRQEAEMLGVL